LALNRVPTLSISRGTLWNIMEHFQRTVANAAARKLIRNCLITNDIGGNHVKTIFFIHSRTRQRQAT